MTSGGETPKTSTAGARVIDLFCPAYPMPRPEVVEAIKSLNNPAVDRWMGKQLALRKKLEKCRE